MSYEIKIADGSWQTMADAGISAAVLTTYNFGNDSLRISFHDDIDATVFANPNDSIQLRQDSPTTIRFSGALEGTGLQATARAQGRQYTFLGGNRILERGDARNENVWTFGGVGSVVMGGAITSRAFTARQSAGTTIQTILDRVLAQFPPSFSYVTADLTALSDLSPIVASVNPKAHAALNAYLTRHPHIVSWWDYSTTPATIRFSDYTDTTARTVSESALDIIASNVVPRFDMLHDAVAHNPSAYFSTATRIDPTSETSDAVTLGTDRSLMINFVVNTGDSIGSIADWLQSLADYYSTLHVDASFHIDGIDWAQLPGDRWTFGGIWGTPTASAKATCHSITRDLFSQTQQLQLGIIKHRPQPDAGRGIRDKEPDDFDLGTGGGSPGGSGSTLGEWFEITDCDGNTYEIWKKTS